MACQTNRRRAETEPARTAAVPWSRVAGASRAAEHRSRSRSGSGLACRLLGLRGRSREAEGNQSRPSNRQARPLERRRRHRSASNRRSEGPAAERLGGGSGRLGFCAPAVRLARHLLCSIFNAKSFCQFGLARFLLSKLHAILSVQSNWHETCFSVCQSQFGRPAVWQTQPNLTYSPSHHRRSQPPPPPFQVLGPGRRKDGRSGFQQPACHPTTPVMVT